jgi:hypothetical protein
MDPRIHPYLTQPDVLVLQTLFDDCDRHPHLKRNDSGVRLASEKEKEDTTASVDHDDAGIDDGDAAQIQYLKDLNDPTSLHFQPTVFTAWDDKDIPPFINQYLVRPYARIASRIVRHPTDIVFLTHILLYFTVNLPSAMYLFYNFTHLHAILHVAFTFWCTGAFTLMMHNHIHNNGVLSASYSWFDFAFPYILEPLMGHTWDSYYYHHVKHHHVEGNGPADLSSTIRYQRDSLPHFLHYVARFLFLIWLDLPLYFLRTHKPRLALRAFASELASMTLMYLATFHGHARAATATLLIPFVLLRLGLMIGNWGQHALVDELDPDSDFRSSITLIDVPSNRFCFNDGYHTAHHLNPRRHWRDQPVHFLQAKQAYADGRALVFCNIDYLMLTWKLVVSKDYDGLARCLVPIGEQKDMSVEEIARMLRRKTRAFSDDEIREKFSVGVSRNARARGKKEWTMTLGGVFQGLRGMVAGAEATPAGPGERKLQ